MHSFSCHLYGPNVNKSWLKDRTRVLAIYPLPLISPSCESGFSFASLTDKLFFIKLRLSILQHIRLHFSYEL